MVEQGAVPFRNRREPLQVIPKERDMEGVDLRELLEFERVVCVVRSGVVRIRNTDFRIRAVACLSG